ncbi:MAG: folate-binding protein YgfZ [Myxococcota bacterium]|jgi:folate-binding protein YgfZ
MTPDTQTLQHAHDARETGFFARLGRAPESAVGLANPGAILVTGSDAASFLHSQVTNDVEGLAPGEGNFSARVNRKGQLLHFFSLHHLPAQEGDAAAYLLILERGSIPDLLLAFDDFVYSDEVTFEDVTEHYAWSTLQGPNAIEALVACTGGDASEEWQAYEVRSVVFTNDAEALIIARSLTGDTGLLVASGKSSPENVVRIEAQLSYSASDAGFVVLEEPTLSSTLEVLRIEAGQVRVGPDTDGRKCILPETGLEQHAVSYTKGCYLGQEVIARIRTYGALPFGLRGLVFECAQENDWSSQRVMLERLPDVGEELFVAGTKKSVGQIVSRTLSPVMGYPIAFAYLDKVHRTPGTQLDIQTAEGVLAARVALLPFYSAPGRDERVAFIYDRAIRVFAQGKEEQALSMLEDALQLDPGFSDGYEAIGVILGRSERYHEAIDIFKRLEELAPEVPMVNTNLSLYYMKIGDKTTAEAHAAKAMQKSLAEGTGGSVSSDELDAQLLEQQVTDAKRKKNMFGQVLEIDPDDGVALYGMGNALATLEDYEGAAASYAKANEVDPKNSAVYLARGKVLEALEQRGDAEAVYRLGMEVASRQGDLMPLKEMEHRVLLLSGAQPGADEGDVK